MRTSLIISIIFHIFIFLVLFVIIKTVPEMNLPDRIYSVRILRPLVGQKEQEEDVDTETKEQAVEKKLAPKPKPEPKEEKTVPKKEENSGESIEKSLKTAVDSKYEDNTDLVVDAPEFPFSYYLGAIERKISRNWFSAISERTGLSCVVYFRLNRNGSVSSARIEEGSGNSYFDRSALKAVRSSVPFPPLPKAFNEPYLGIHFTFVQGSK